MSNKILLVIDAQNDFVTGDMIVPGAANTVALIACMIGKFDTVIYIQDWHNRGHCSFVNQGGTKPPHCVATTWGSRVVEALPRQLSNTTFKNVRKGRHRDTDSYSAFYDQNRAYETELRSVLTQLSRPDENMKLYICGFITEGCVLNTVLDALPNFTHVTVLDDACRGRNEERALAALEVMADHGAMIIPSTSVVGAPADVPAT